MDGGRVADRLYPSFARATQPVKTREVTESGAIIKKYYFLYNETILLLIRSEAGGNLY